jgi:hypothetical protein
MLQALSLAGVMSMQPLDPSLFGGSAPPNQPTGNTPDTDTGVLPKGTDVWYNHRSGAWQPARVTAVDETILPAFYQVLQAIAYTEL